MSQSSASLRLLNEVRFPTFMTIHRLHMPVPPVSLVVAPPPRDISDQELASALIEGKSWAIGETWHRFAPPVIMLARRALGSESEAEDVAQEVF